MDYSKNDSCSGCEKSILLFDASVATGLCLICREKLVPEHIPHDQQKRYLERIGYA
jgi:hypothetical protein